MPRQTNYDKLTHEDINDALKGCSWKAPDTRAAFEGAVHHINEQHANGEYRDTPPSTEAIYYVPMKDVLKALGTNNSLSESNREALYAYDMPPKSSFYKINGEEAMFLSESGLKALGAEIPPFAGDLSAARATQSHAARASAQR